MLLLPGALFFLTLTGQQTLLKKLFLYPLLLISIRCP